MTAQRPEKPSPPPCFAAIDLGTNNCRLLIACAAPGGFRVVESFSRIVRLGDGLHSSGRLDERAMERALAALRICADKIRRRGAVRVRAVATQACRAAANGEAFIRRVAEETGLEFTVISPREEARLSVQGCLNLLDRSAEAALVVDVGGGSTEVSWVDLSAGPRVPPRIGAWLSIPLGVVTLAETHPEREDGEAWFEEMTAPVEAELRAFTGAERFRPAFAAAGAHLVGTSGAITSLAGMHLGLARYERSRVDGLWMTHAECQAAARRLMSLGREGRAREPCIGPDRADLVLAGAAILEAVQRVWTCPRVRVADRGLREGILLTLIAQSQGRRGRRRRRGAVAPPAPVRAAAGS